MTKDRRIEDIISSSPESIREILETIIQLGDDASPIEVGEALEPLRSSKPHRREWQIARELLIKAVKSTGAVSAPSRFVDEYMTPSVMKNVEVRKGPHEKVETEKPRISIEQEIPKWPDEVPLAINRYGEIKPTLANALLFVRFYPGLRGKLRYNKRSLCPEWVGRTPWSRSDRDSSMTEEDAVEASTWISSAEGVGFSKESIISAFITESQQKRYDPVEDYLNALEWDGVDRVSTVLVDHFGANDSLYVRETGKCWLISAVARVFNPGCKVDYMLVLEGPQGVGKTEALNALAGDFFAEVTIDPSRPDTVMAIHGPWIVEWSELSGISRREYEAIKGFISRKVDRFRAPYARKMEYLPRRCVFSATTNEKAWINDPTGGRKYWPVKINKANPEMILKNKDQIWAQAVNLFKDGVIWWLDKETEREAIQIQKKRMIQDTWDDKISAWIDSQPIAYLEFISTAELLSRALELPAGSQTPQTSKRLSAAMERLGWEPCRYTAPGTDSMKKKRGYRPSKATDDQFEE